MNKLDLFRNLLIGHGLNITRDQYRKFKIIDISRLNW